MTTPTHRDTPPGHTDSPTCLPCGRIGQRALGAAPAVSVPQPVREAVDALGSLLANLGRVRGGRVIRWVRAWLHRRRLAAQHRRTRRGRDQPE